MLRFLIEIKIKVFICHSIKRDLVIILNADNHTI